MPVLRFFRLSLRCAFVAVIVTACVDLPQPFRTGRDFDLPLPATPSILGVGVLPVAGVSEDTSRSLAQYVAEALQERDVPAEAVDGVGRLGFSLETTVIGANSSPDDNAVRYQWRVVGRSSADVHHSGSETSAMDMDFLRNPSEEDLQRFAAAVGERVANAIAPPTIAAVPESPWAGITVRIEPPLSAPGDGAASLPRQLANRFARAGFEPPMETADFTVSGTVTVSAYDSVQEDVAIVWTVTDSSGNNLGDVRLDNRIPIGELDGPWGLIAEAIVDASLPGILEIIAVAKANSAIE